GNMPGRLFAELEIQQLDNARAAALERVTEISVRLLRWKIVGVLHDVTAETIGKSIPLRQMTFYDGGDELRFVFNHGRQPQIAPIHRQKNDVGFEFRHSARRIQNLLLRRAIHSFVDFSLDAIPEKTSLQNRQEQAGSTG